MLVFICLYIISHYVIQYICLSTSRRLTFFISVAISGYGGVGIGCVTGRFADIIVALLERLSPDLIYLFQFTERAELVGNALNNFFFLPKSPQLLLPLMFELIVTSGRNDFQNGL